MTCVTQPLMIFTAMAISVFLSSLMFVEVASFHLSGTSSFVSSSPGQLLQPRQTDYAPLFASNDGEDTTDSSTTSFATVPESIGEKVFAELDNMRKQFAELTESLTMAKQREEQAKGDVTRLTDEKKTVDAEKDSVISGKKRVLRYVFLVHEIRTCFNYSSCKHYL